jgi:hypothetical protein
MFSSSFFSFCFPFPPSLPAVLIRSTALSHPQRLLPLLLQSSIFGWMFSFYQLNNGELVFYQFDSYINKEGDNRESFTGVYLPAEFSISQQVFITIHIYILYRKISMNVILGFDCGIRNEMKRKRKFSFDMLSSKILFKCSH